jgi:uncharacterized OB-fold protein
VADPPAAPELPFRILPRLTDLNRGFWTGGEAGELRFLRCRQCGYYNHPPTPICPICHSKDLRYEKVSGRATLWTFTVNHQPWMPGPELPYVVAIVALPEQEGLRLTTNLVGVALPSEGGSGSGEPAPERPGLPVVEIGMELEVTFEHHDDVWIPLFRPLAGA